MEISVFSHQMYIRYLSTEVSFWTYFTEVIPKSLPVLSTEPVLRKAVVDRELRFSTEQYGCRQRDNMILTPLEKRKRKF